MASLGHVVESLVVLVAVVWGSMQMVWVLGLSEHAGMCGVGLD